MLLGQTTDTTDNRISIQKHKVTKYFLCQKQKQQNMPQVHQWTYQYQFFCSLLVNFTYI